MAASPRTTLSYSYIIIIISGDDYDDDETYIRIYRRSLRPLPYRQMPLLTIPSRRRRRRRRRGERVAKSCSGARARTPHLSPKLWRIYIYLSHRRRRRYSRGMESGYSYIHVVWYIIYRVVLTPYALFVVVGDGYFTWSQYVYYTRLNVFTD